MDFLDKLRLLYGNKIQLMGKFRRTATLRFKCYTCLNSFKASPAIADTYTPCPICSGKTKSRAKIKEIEIEGVTLRLQGFEPQAVRWLLARNPKLRPSHLTLDSSGDAPKIPYKIGRRNRTYYPDIYIERQNRIIEVKSVYTLGLARGRGWGKAQAKAKACIALGYRYTLMLMTQKGKRLWIPKDWYLKSRQSVINEIEHNTERKLRDARNDSKQNRIRPR